MRGKGKIKIGWMAGIAIFLLSQCSPFAGEKMLNFFFDGVPEGDTLQTEMTHLPSTPSDSMVLDEEIAILSQASRVIHYPYEEGECGSCHNEKSLGTLVEEQPGLCYLCHEDLSASYDYLHGPVAGGYCTSCHDPHRSESGKLLRMSDDKLCLHCHNKEDVEKNEMHQDLDGMLCMDCHNPHGGEDKYIFQ